MEVIMAELLLASTNNGKLREFQALLEGLHFRLLSPFDLLNRIDVPEVGKTYAENASLKASTYSNHTGLLSLADDSGLEVDALGGAPGIISARYSPKPGATDADRRSRLLQQLEIFPRPWIARFHCTVALAEPGGDVHLAEGICLGEIIPEERGQHGFGYDPIFYLPDLGKTMAELVLEEKNTLSHRALAVKKVIPILRNKLQ
jgi:XTP/dITP diphosphohydrolase